MIIRSVIFYLEEYPPGTRSVSSRLGAIEKTPPGLSNVFTHALGFRKQRPDEVIEFQDPQARPSYLLTLRMETDGGMSAWTGYASGYSALELEWQAKGFLAQLAPMLKGVDAFDREYIWQRLFTAQRFFYTGRMPVDVVDNALWDFASRYTGQPIYRLLGGARTRVPAYRNIGGPSIDELAADARRAQAEGFRGVKDHAYLGARQYAVAARELRAAVGPGFPLMHDAVWSYDFNDAVRIGRVLERYEYSWLEEPLMDYDLLGAKKLCEALDLPVMAMEWIGAVGGQPFTASAYLALGATDIVRQRALGITGQIKLAQLAECFGRKVHGGNPHVVLAITNDDMYEWVGPIVRRPPEEELTAQGTAILEDGYLTIATGERNTPEPDWDALARRAVGVFT